MIRKNTATMKFFKVLLPGFETKMGLPPRFCTKASAHFSAEAVVTTSLGCWKIDVGKCSGQFYFHGDHWDSFVKGHELRVGYFIVFEHHGSMHFDALIFDSSACEKEFPASFVSRIADETPVQPGIISCSKRTFRKKLSAYSGCDYYMPHRSCLFIPRETWKVNNLHKKEKAILRIPGCSRKEWLVKRSFYEDREGHKRYGRLAMTKGWLEFCSSNNIKRGGECTFEIMDTALGLPDNVVKITVTIFSK